MFNYATINDDDICYAISSLSGEVQNAKMIRISNYDVSFIGKRYVDGQWEIVEL